MSTYITFGDYQGQPRTGSLFGELEPIVFRPEQEEAISMALKQFCSSTGRGDQKVFTPLTSYQQFLWNAKMRFGKTLCALELARRMGVQRILIVTHRPVVDEGWHDDFKKIFNGTNYRYATRTEDEQSGDFYALNRRAMEGKGGFVFFVSMQYLRLSELLNDKTQAKNNVHNVDENYVASNENERLKAEILKADWDLVVVDEAHEGTRTALGFRVINEYLKKKSTKMLHLSGTPFNLYEDFANNEIFTWDYISEQKAKNEWPHNHPGEPNPYAELPQMKIFTYDISANLGNVLDHDGLFTFSEFFRTWTGNPKADGGTMPNGAKGKFVHELEVLKFLDLLCTKDDENNFPFATDEYRKQFRHTLWVVSRIDEAKALAELLRQHPRFRNRFKVINVAGTKESDEQMDNALDEVKRAIGDIPEQTATITISCGRLTTGVTIKPWTAVLYLKGGDRAATYMQTIFRVQSPYVTRDGKMKTSCCVFDFMPDRTLKIVAETSKFSSMAKAKAKSNTEDEEDKTQETRDKETVAAFVDLCPLISMDGGRMAPLEVGEIYKQLESVFIDRLVTKGFDDPCLYVQDELNKIDPEILNAIGENGGQAPDERRQEAKPTVDLSHMTEEQRKAWEENIKLKKAAAAEAARKKALRDEEFRKMWEGWTEQQRQDFLQKEAEKQARREEAKKQREEFRKRITNIRGIALRIPLLMYGGADAGDTTEDLTVENFTRKIKDESWAEFMPKGITKQDFNKIKRCFNATRFEEAGKRYREMTREADYMHIWERIERITWIFDSFRNPDKETVLTPWRVVNMHMSDTLGGFCFFNERFDGPNEEIVEGTEGKIFDFVETHEPRFVDHGDVTITVYGKIAKGQGIASRILEINSKTGLYPLYVAYTMYRKLLEYYDKEGVLDNPIETLSISEEQAIWDDVVSNNIYVITNTPMAAHITQRTLLGFREPSRKLNIKSDKLIERATTERGDLVDSIKTIGYWNGTTNKTMIKFDAVVGNPPYQLRDKGECTSSTAIYPEFIELARSLSGNVSLITPSRWMTKQGRGLSEEWAEKMLKSNHFITIKDFLDASDCFPRVEIKGGVCYFLYDEMYNGKCNYVIVQNGHNKTKECFLCDWGMVIRDEKADEILTKVSKIEGERYYETRSFSHLVMARHQFDQGPLLSTGWRGFNETKQGDYSIKCYLNKQLLAKGYGWVRLKDIPKNHKVIDMHKIYISKAYGAGETFPHQIIGVPFYGEPNSVCTDTYIVIRPEQGFVSETECQNVISYMRTRLFRYMVFIKKKTQDAARDVYQFVPLQDFSQSWNDEKLYKKYDLSREEISYIESMIKAMDMTLFDGNE